MLQTIITIYSIGWLIAYIIFIGKLVCELYSLKNRPCKMVASSVMFMLLVWPITLSVFIVTFIIYLFRRIFLYFFPSKNKKEKKLNFVERRELLNIKEELKKTKKRLQSVQKN